MQHTGKMTNSVTTTEQPRSSSKETFDNMKNGIEHTSRLGVVQPVQLSTSSPSATYNEKWYFKKVESDWNPVTNKVDTPPDAIRVLPPLQLQLQRLGIDDRIRHVRLHQEAKDRKIQAIRHIAHPPRSDSPTRRTSWRPNTATTETRQTDLRRDASPIRPIRQRIRRTQFRRSMSMNFCCRRTSKQRCCRNATPRA